MIYKYGKKIIKETKTLGSQRIFTKVIEEFMQNASSYVNYKDMESKLCTV